MRYLITANLKESDLPAGSTALAKGEAIALEDPWPFGQILVSQVQSGFESNLGKLRNVPNIVAFDVVGLAEPGNGSCIMLGTHIMKDLEGMKPYIDGVPPVIAPYKCTYLARTSSVTQRAGADTFKPDRVAVMEFPDAEHAMGFYTDAAYGKLLPIRLRCTVPREIIIMKTGTITDAARQTIKAKVPAASAA